MNINDYDAIGCPPNWASIVGSLFTQQAQLLAKYREIEELPKDPVALHHWIGQRCIRDFAWRTVEELTESCQAIMDDPDETARHHQLEELADATHFFVELLIFSGIGVTQALASCSEFPGKIPGSTPVEELYWWPVYHIGLAMNFLKNRTWRKSHTPTDEKRFREAVLIAWRELIQVWANVDADEKEMWTYFSKKTQVNDFRVRSAY